MAKQKYWNGTAWEVVGTDAAKVSLADTSNKFTATDVEGAMLELFTFANNGKVDIATVIGSPATTSDTFATLKGRVQTNKTNLATNLVNKGTSASGTETLAALVAKVANVNTGKKMASGTVTTTGSTPWDITVSGLTFTARTILLVIVGQESNALIHTLYSADLSTQYIYFAGTNERLLMSSYNNYVNSTGFKIHHWSYYAGQIFWIAYE